MGVLSRSDYESALRLVGDAGAGIAYDETVSTLLDCVAVETRTAAIVRLKG